MSTFLVGLTMSSPTHDYTKARIALRLLKARKVSERIHLCDVADDKGPLVFALLQRCLAARDRVIVETAPPAFLTSRAA